MDIFWCLDDLYTSFESTEFLADFGDASREIADISAWAGENFANTSLGLEDAGEKLTTYIN